MQIIVNGQPQDCAQDATLLAYLQQQGLDPQAVVAELQGQIVQQADFGATLLHSGDHLELLRFVGGG